MADQIIDESSPDDMLEGSDFDSQEVSQAEIARIIAGYHPSTERRFEQNSEMHEEEIR